jgi:hypothetical protein
MDSKFEQFRNLITRPFMFNLFALRQLPAVFFAGLHIELLNETKAIISVRQKWFNKNPFRSIYFAVLSMAGELSTGLLCMGNIYERQPPVSMLVTEQRALFHKKATGKIIFICEDGKTIAAAADEALTTKNAVSIVCYSKGLNADNELIAEIWITWSFKARRQ